MIECLGHLKGLTWILYTREDGSLFFIDSTDRIILDMHGPQHNLLRMVADWGLGLGFPDHPVLQGMGHGGRVGSKLSKTATRGAKGHRRDRLGRVVV